MGGFEDEVAGKAKEAEGTVTGDAQKEAEGTAQKELGAAEQDAKNNLQEVDVAARMLKSAYDKGQQATSQLASASASSAAPPARPTTVPSPASPSPHK